MKVADFPGLTVTAPPAARNGTHRSTKKNGPAPKRSAGGGARADARPAAQPVDGTFATMEAEPIDAPMWPLHPALWFQPERAPSAPVWTGLVIERHNRIPAPDFLHSEIAPTDRPGTLDRTCDALTPGARRELPESGLMPLGWDARAVCRKEGGE
jgi:hypothetical protein